jgi:hypothetical protein
VEPKTLKYFLGFEVFIAIIMNGTIIWDATQCGLVEIVLLLVGFLLGLLFNFEKY